MERSTDFSQTFPTVDADAYRGSRKMVCVIGISVIDGSPMMHLTEEKYADERELYSGLIRLHILHHAERESIFGLGMIEELARHGYKLSPGTLYPLLHRMEKKGLLHSHKRLKAGKIRRVYKSTASGRHVLSVAKEKVYELFGVLFEDESKRKRRKKT